RVQGIVSKGIRVFRRRQVIDEVLAHRVRTELGRIVTNATGIRVQARNGHVTLSGSVLQPEYLPLLKRIQKIAGVQTVDNRLTPRWPNEPSAHGHETRSQGFGFPPRGKASAT